MLRNSEESRGGVLRNSVDNSLKSPSPVDKPHGGSRVGHREKPRSGLQRLRHFPGTPATRKARQGAILTAKTGRR